MCQAIGDDAGKIRPQALQIVANTGGGRGVRRAVVHGKIARHVADETLRGERGLDTRANGLRRSDRRSETDAQQAESERERSDVAHNQNPDIERCYKFERHRYR